MNRSNELKILLLGDTFLGGELTNYWYKYSDFNPFKRINGLHKSSDIVYSNIENSFYRGPLRPFRTGHLWAPPDSIAGLKKLGINVASIANNHIMDFGYSAMVRTKKLLNENGIKCIGVGFDVDEASAGCIIEKKDWRVAFLAFTTNAFHVRSVLASKFSVGCAPMREKNMKSALLKLKKNSDIICVGLHWGYEFTHVPHQKQRSLAAKLIEWGADVIVGTHPHVIQGFEIIKNRPVFYSLGNLIFPEYEGLDGKKIRWNDENNGSIAGLIKCNSINDELNIDVEIIPLKFNFPYVEILRNSEKREFETKFSLWNDAIKGKPIANRIIHETEIELKERNLEWRKKWLRRLLWKISFFLSLFSPYKFVKLKKLIKGNKGGISFILC